MDRGTFEHVIAPYENVVIDLGTGDGFFVYHCAREDPRSFFIGIDANRRPLEKISEKICRKPSKGGLSNVLYLQSAVETLPSELEGVATDLYVNFPWGSLLHAVATGEESVLRSLRGICARGARVHVFLGLDAERDRSEIERLKLPALSEDYVMKVLAPRYRSAGLKITEARSLPTAALKELHTSWARRLSQSPNRLFMKIVAQATD